MEWLWFFVLLIACIVSCCIDCKESTPANYNNNNPTNINQTDEAYIRNLMISYYASPSRQRKHTQSQQGEIVTTNQCKNDDFEGHFNDEYTGISVIHEGQK